MCNFWALVKKVRNIKSKKLVNLKSPKVMHGGSGGEEFRAHRDELQHLADGVTVYSR